MELAVLAYRLTKTFPRDEMYGLTSQIRRAASSVPANIAAGFGRSSTGSYLQYLRTARGSLNELDTHIDLSVRVGIVSDSEVLPALRLTEKVGRMISSTIRSIETTSDERPATSNK